MIQKDYSDYGGSARPRVSPRLVRSQWGSRSSGVLGFFITGVRGILQFFSSFFRLLLASVVLLLLLSFVMLWLVLPRFLEVKQDKLVIITTPSTFALVQLVQGKTAEIKVFDRSLVTSFKQDPLFTKTPQYFSTRLGIIIDEVLDIETLSESFFTQRQIRIRYMLSHIYWLLKNTNVLQLVLLTHISLNTHGQPSILTDLTEVEKIQLKSQGLERSLSYSCPVSVVNTTPVSGLATHIAKMLESGGMIVVRVGSLTNSVIDDTVIVTSPDTLERCTDVLQKIQAVVAPTTKVKIDAVLPAQYRASIVILLGTNAEKLLGTTE